MKKRMISFLAVLLLFLGPITGLGEELMIAAPGDSGYDVERVLAMAKGMGYIKSMESGEENYKEKYIDGVKAMEAAFFLNADGVIRLSEMQMLEKLIYPGCEGSKVEYLLEKLYDLGFITEKLPSSHASYSASYKSAVKKAEKQYGLTEDGILTSDEQNTIFNKTVTPPGMPTNVKSSVSGTTITLTWNKVKDAVYYNIWLNGLIIDTAKGTSYTYSNAEKGTWYTFHVSAAKYTVRSSANTESVDVVLYASPTISELEKDPDLWEWKYVKISNTKMVRKIYEGNDIYILVKKTENGKTHHLYLKIGGYKDWTYDSGGQLQFSEVQGTIRGEGYFLPDTHYSTTYGYLPVIELTHIKWEY